MNGIFKNGGIVSVRSAQLKRRRNRMYEKLTALTGPERVRAIEHNLDVAHFTYGPNVSKSHALPDWYRRLAENY